jgi:hypothetical protein
MKFLNRSMRTGDLIRASCNTKDYYISCMRNKILSARLLLLQTVNADFSQEISVA